MVYKVLYTESAQRDLSKIDRLDVRKILTKIDNILELTNPLSKAKRLTNYQPATYRFRIGDYRAVFRLDHKTNQIIILIILKIAHRKDVYR